MDPEAIKDRQREISGLADYSYISRVLPAGRGRVVRGLAMQAEFTELVRRRGGEGPVRIEDEYVVIVACGRG